MDARPTIEHVWSLYGDRLRRYLSIRIPNQADVDDLLQEVLLKTHRRMDSVRNLAELRSWLFRVTRNTLVDHHRRALRTKEGRLGDEHRLAVFPPEVSEADQVELAECVRAFLRRLEPRERELLEAIDLEGKTQRQVADDLQIPHSTIRSRVQRARGRLAASLASCCAVEMAPDGRFLGTPNAVGSCDQGCATNRTNRRIAKERDAK